MQKAIETNPVKPSILAQKLAKHAHQSRLRWLLAVSALPLCGVLAAYAIAPQYADAPVNQASIEFALDLAPIAKVAETTTLWQTERVKRDDTLANLCRRLNITEREAIQFLKNDAETKSFFSRLKTEQAFHAQTNIDGALLSLSFATDDAHILQITRLGKADDVAQFKTELLSAAITHREVMKSVTIKSSLFAATDFADIPDAVAMKVAEVFSSDIDFNSDLRRGDHLSVVYKTTLTNENNTDNELLAVEFINNGKTYQAVQYVNASGEADFYTPDGKSLHKSFLRTPVEFSRISSGFTMGRFHPILNRMRAHKGVDYAAPTGTRIKAPGDGVVKFVGTKSGYGNVIMLSHDNGVTTIYGHLSRFESGLHVGEKVSQGDVIGFVGMTGLATGPHLHYEFLINGEHRDPMTVALPKAAPVPANEMAQFMQTSVIAAKQLAMLSNTNIAAID